MFTVWLPTGYSIDRPSAEQSVDGHISASPGIWPMADCYIVLCLIPRPPRPGNEARLVVVRRKVVQIQGCCHVKYTVGEVTTCDNILI